MHADPSLSLPLSFLPPSELVSPEQKMFSYILVYITLQVESLTGSRAASLESIHCGQRSHRLSN